MLDNPHCREILRISNTQPDAGRQIGDSVAKGGCDGASRVIVPLATTWEEVLPAIVIAVVAGALATFWPALQLIHRGRKFEGIIRRELEEIAPHPTQFQAGKQWWEHATKRFVHEEIFATHNISQNRDFLLSLNGDVVYKVSQLWIALEKHDADQWIEYLRQLSEDRRTTSDRLVDAYKSWLAVIYPEFHGGARRDAGDESSLQQGAQRESGPKAASAR